MGHQGVYKSALIVRVWELIASGLFPKLLRREPVQGGEITDDMTYHGEIDEGGLYPTSEIWNQNITGVRAQKSKMILSRSKRNMPLRRESAT